MNRVTEIDYPSPLGNEQFGYDANGNLWWKTDGNGNTTLYKYGDAMNRLTDVYYNYTGSLPPTSYPSSADVTYTYYGSSSLKATMVDSSGTSSYTYDIQNRLGSYTPPQPSGHAAVTYAYNNLGQKTAISTTNYSVTYDYFANGWLKDVMMGSNLISSYVYDIAGNRTETDFGNSTKQTYTCRSHLRLLGLM